MFLSGGILWGPRRQQYPLAGGVSFVSSRPPGIPSVIKAGGILGSPPMAGMGRKQTLGLDGWLEFSASVQDINWGTVRDGSDLQLPGYHSINDDYVTWIHWAL